MKIKAKRSSFGDFGNVARGQVIDVPERKAKELIVKGVFAAYDEKAEALAAAEREAQQQAREEAFANAEREEAAAQTALLEELQDLRSQLSEMQGKLDTQTAKLRQMDDLERASSDKDLRIAAATVRISTLERELADAIKDAAEQGDEGDASNGDTKAKKK